MKYGIVCSFALLAALHVSADIVFKAVDYKQACQWLMLAVEAAKSKVMESDLRRVKAKLTVEQLEEGAETRRSRPRTPGGKAERGGTSGARTEQMTREEQGTNP